MLKKSPSDPKLPFRRDIIQSESQEKWKKAVTTHTVHHLASEVYYNPDLRDLAVLTGADDDNHHPSALDFSQLPFPVLTPRRRNISTATVTTN